jgi:hypothetical protein
VVLIAVTDENSLHFERLTFHFLTSRQRVLLYVTLTAVLLRIETIDENSKMRFPILFTVNSMKKAL